MKALINITVHILCIKFSKQIEITYLLKGLFPQVLQMIPEDHTSSYHLIANSILTHVKLRPHAANQPGPSRPEQGTYLAFCFRELENEWTGRLRPDSVGEGRGVLSERGLAAATWARPRPKGQKETGQEYHKLRG